MTLKLTLNNPNQHPAPNILVSKLQLFVVLIGNSARSSVSVTFIVFLQFGDKMSCLFVFLQAKQLMQNTVPLSYFS